MLILRLLRELLRLVAFPVLYARRVAAAPRGGYVAFTLDGAVHDVVPRRTLLDRVRRRSPATSLFALAAVLDAVVADRRLRGVLVTLHRLGGRMGTATSLRALLARVRASGKEVVVHLPMGGGTREAYVASAASRVVLGPQATLAPAGFAAHLRYVRGALDRAGVVPEVYARGRYKTAAEGALRSSMSEPQREQLEALLDTQHRVLVDGLAEGRGMERDRAVAIVDGAPYVGVAAVASGLVDALGYEDDVHASLGGPKRVVAAGAYRAARKRALPRSPFAPAVIAVLEVRGTIAHKGGFAVDAVSTDDAFIAAVRAARQSRRVKAVIVSIDSPGGSALASDRMHHELVQLAREKPVVACMADVAASGGYYVAAAAHVIVARPTTVTGSIGVIAARLAVDGLLERFGVTTEVVERGAHAALLTSTRAFRDDERAIIDKEIDAIYRGFLEVVAAGRNRPVADVEKVAEGRVWSGRDAHRVGLVDRLGGFDDALDEARRRVGGGALEPVVLRGGRPGPPLPLPEPARALLPPAVLAALGPLSLALGGERVLAYCPVAAACVSA